MYYKNWIFQMDHDTVHQAKKVKAWLHTKNVDVLEWIDKGQDLNPIENLFFQFKRRMQEVKFVNLYDYTEKANKVWKSIDKKILRSLVSSMLKRLSLIWKNNGGNMKY